MNRMILSVMMVMVPTAVHAARVPEPDAVYHGTVSVDFQGAPGTPVTANSRRTIHATVNGVTVASYPMGYFPAVADRYVMMLPLETRTAGESQDVTVAHPGAQVTFWADDIELTPKVTLAALMKDVRGTFTDQTFTSKFTVTRPDLVVENFDIQGGFETIAAGEPLRVTGNIRNAGSADCPPYQMQFYIWQMPDMSDLQPLTQAFIPRADSMAPGAIDTLDSMLALDTLPTVVPGLYNLAIDPDPINTIVEVAENNFDDAPTQIMITPPMGGLLADLTIHNLDFQVDGGGPEFRILFTGTVVNGGENPVTTAFTTQFWGSENLALFSGDELLASDLVLANLGPGETVNLEDLGWQTLPPLPQVEAGAPMRVGVMVDARFDVPESVEFNNLVTVNHRVLELKQNSVRTWEIYD